MARFLTWGALYLMAFSAMTIAFAVALDFGVPPHWAAYPPLCALAWIWANRMFRALGLTP